MMNKSSVLIGWSTLVSIVMLVGCINNDVPYPHIAQQILSIRVEGESQPATIDSASFMATVYLDESVNIKNVRFTQFTVSEGAEYNKNLLDGSYDLSQPIDIVLTRWYDYNWKIVGVQEIERYCVVAGQLGESVIDPIGHSVMINMPEGTDLAALKLDSIKLGPKGHTTMLPNLQPGVINLSKPVKVEVEAWGEKTVWTLYASLSELVVNTTAVDAWSKVIWAYGAGPSDAVNGFQYRRADSDEWIDVPQERVVSQNGVFSCSIPGLEPLTEYVVRTVSGEDLGNEVHVTTQATADIPNGDFENWCKIGNIDYPFAEGGTQFWDTGNKGASTMGQNITVPSDNTPTGSGKSAELTTRFLGIGIIGKLAAGSIFTGTFKKVDGTNGILDFGREWNLRPTALKGFFQYKAKNIDYASSEWSALKGRPDTCIIYVALTDWTAPYEIRTNPKTRTLFDKNAPYVIGYGEFQFSGNMESFEEFEIPITYRSTSKVPSYLQITCSTSKYGDYFTGGSGSVLWVDQFSFSYDLK